MPVELASGYVSLIPSARGFGTKLASQIGPEVAQAAGKAGVDAAGRFSTDFANKAISAGKKMTLGLTLPLGLLGKASFDAASDLAESMSKSDTIFGKSAGEIRKWASNASTSFGQSKQSALENAASFGNMFTQLGIGVPVAAKMSKKMVELASDFASFHNADITEVLLAQQAAFRGEYDAVQRFVPTINAAAVETKALEQTGKENAKQLTNQEKATAAYTLMLEGAGKAQGDFGRTSEGAANQQRILKAQLQDTMADIGAILIPIVQQAITAISGLASGFRSLPQEVQTGIVAFGIFAAALGPIMVVGGNVIKLAGGIGSAFGALHTGFQLTAVRGLELIESFKKITLAGSLMAGGLALGFAAMAAGLYVIFTASERLAPGLKAAEEQGKRWAQQFVTDVKGSAHELDELITGQKNLEAAQARITNGKFGEALKSNSQETINYSEGAKKAQIQLRELGVQHEVVTARIKTLREEQVSQAAQTALTRKAIGEYIAGIEQGNSATGAFANLTGEARKAVETFQAAILASAGGQVAYQQSLINIGIAEANLAKAVAEHGAGSVEATAAQLALDQARLQGVQAAGSLDNANQELIRSLITIPGYYDAEIGRLQQLQREHPENAAGYQLEIDKLNDAKAAADRLAGFLATVTVTADTSQADNAIGNFFARWRSEGGINIGFGIHVKETAVGGIFDRPQIRLISEAGPEAVLPLNDPARSMQILAETGLLSNSQSAAIPEASGATGGLRIDNAVFGDRDVIPDLDYWARTRMAAS